MSEIEEGKASTRSSVVANADLVPDAGKVKMEEGRLWGKAIIDDIKNTVGSHWIQGMTNFNQKTVAVTLLLFISVIAPTLTFGAVYGKVTGSQIGTVETILATSWVGVAYSLIGGMPLCVMGSTGPVLAMTRGIITVAEKWDVPFLTLNVWVSLWLLIYCFICGFFDMTRIVKLTTRFTDGKFRVDPYCDIVY